MIIYPDYYNQRYQTGPWWTS